MMHYYLQLGNKQLESNFYEMKFLKCKHSKFTELQNKLSWKGDQRAQLLALHSIIPRSHTMCLRASSKPFLNSGRLVLGPLPWGAFSSAQRPSG